MIKLKTKIVGKNEDSQFVKIEQYKTKNTNTIEHICVIDTLVYAIMDNDENMTIDKLCKLIKSNYKIHLKESESEK